MIQYPVVDIFQSLCGEGRWVGHRATFIRLAGCSVDYCYIRDYCDEAKGVGGVSKTLERIMGKVWSKSSGGIVVITGGEPTDHDLVPLLDELHEKGYRVHLETSGVRDVRHLPFDWVCVSPKDRNYAARIGDELKIIVHPEMTHDYIKSFDIDTHFSYRYVQPLTVDGMAINRSQVIQFLMSPANWQGKYALSTQAHAAWGIE